MIETIEDQRALQLALELSLLGLNPEQNNISNSDHSNNIVNAHPNFNGFTSGTTTTGNMMLGLTPDLQGAAPMAPQPKKSQNTTECVPVPSSEHVAEIVGRQGCKIKALRAKTNTYIKTPVRGEEPVFVVTGRKEDVANAKREILSAAEHFSQIRDKRKNSNGIGPNPNANIPGQTTIQVRVPYRVVGLVVGPKGATIKRIQQNTNTYIITPSREKEPIFEVTGLPDQVERARSEIEAHIALRTGGLIDSRSIDPTAEDAITNGLNGLGLFDGNHPTRGDSMFNSPLFPTGLVNGLCSKSPATTNLTATNGLTNGLNGVDPFSVILSSCSTSRNTTGMIMDVQSHQNGRMSGSDSLDLFGNGQFNGRPNHGFTSLINSNSISSNSCDSDEGLAESPTFDPHNNGIGSMVGANPLHHYSSVWSDTGIGASSSSSCAASSISSTTSKAISPPSRRSSSIGSPSDVFPVTINGTQNIPSQGQATQIAQGQHNGSEFNGCSTNSSISSSGNAIEYFNSN